MHVTLKFIGSRGRGQERRCDLRRRSRQIRSERPVDMDFRGLGFFPNERRPRVVWCGVEASANLAKLAGDIDGSRWNRWEYSANRGHIRAASDAGAARPGKDSPREKSKSWFDAAKKFAGNSFGSARETEFHLYESVLKPSGAEYRMLQSFPVRERFRVNAPAAGHWSSRICWARFRSAI